MFILIKKPRAQIRFWVFPLNPWPRSCIGDDAPGSAVSDPCMKTY